jgi:GNAT superfamily N-acetyltransferase
MTQHKQTLRRAEGRDAGGLGQCLEAAYAEYTGRIDGLPDMSDSLADEISDKLVWVAVSGDAVAGGMVLAPDDGFMMLNNVAVHSDHRGTGLGKRLLILAESEALSHGYGELRLNPMRT